MAHLCLIFILFVTSCVGLQGEEPQTAHLMSITWASHIAASVLTGRYTLTQSINNPITPSIPNWMINQKINQLVNDSIPRVSEFHITCHLSWASGGGTTNTISTVHYVNIFCNRYHKTCSEQGVKQSMINLHAGSCSSYGCCLSWEENGDNENVILSCLLFIEMTRLTCQ